jgi:hypothetical protein
MYMANVPAAIAARKLTLSSLCPSWWREISIGVEAVLVTRGNLRSLQRKQIRRLVPAARLSQGRFQRGTGSLGPIRRAVRPDHGPVKGGIGARDKGEHARYQCAVLVANTRLMLAVFCATSRLRNASVAGQTAHADTDAMTGRTAAVRRINLFRIQYAGKF